MNQTNDIIRKSHDSNGPKRVLRKRRAESQHQSRRLHNEAAFDSPVI